MAGVNHQPLAAVYAHPCTVRHVDAPAVVLAIPAYITPRPEPSAHIRLPCDIQISCGIKIIGRPVNGREVGVSRIPNFHPPAVLQSPAGHPFVVQRIVIERNCQIGIIPGAVPVVKAQDVPPCRRGCVVCFCCCSGSTVYVKIIYTIPAIGHLAIRV